MRVTPEIIRRGLLGLDAKIVRCKHPDYVDIKGRVIDETRNTLTIFSEGKKKIVVKNISVFHFTMSDGTIVEINGKIIVGRPEDRIKRRVRRRW